jgi:hypothetical protein
MRVTVETPVMLFEAYPITRTPQIDKAEPFPLLNIRHNDVVENKTKIFMKSARELHGRRPLIFVYTFCV